MKLRYQPLKGNSEKIYGQSTPRICQ